MARWAGAHAASSCLLLGQQTMIETHGGPGQNSLRPSTKEGRMASSLRWSLVALYTLAAVACAASAWAQKKHGPGVTDTEIKIGQTYPYSGPLSAYATIARTQAAVFEKINAEGG